MKIILLTFSIFGLLLNRTNAQCATSCNSLVSNGNFEEHLNTFLCGEIPIGSELLVDCWHRYRSTPDYLSYDCNIESSTIPTSLDYTNPSDETWNNDIVNNNHFFGLWGKANGSDIDEEAIWQALSQPMIPGEFYVLDFYARVGNGSIFLNINANLAICFSASQLDYDSNNLYDIDNEIMANGDVLFAQFPSITVENVQVGVEPWQHFVLPFQFDGTVSMQNILIGYDASILDTGGDENLIEKRYIMLDDVRLIKLETNDDIVATIPAVCQDEGLVNLFDFVTLGGGEFIDEQGDVLENGMFDPGMYSIGNHVIFYSAVNTGGCWSTEEFEINVTGMCCSGTSYDFENDLIISSLLTWQNLIENGGEVIVFGGDLVMATPQVLPYSAFNKTFVFAEGKEMILEPGVSVNLYTCTLTSCTTWEGIRLRSLPNGTASPSDDLQAKLFLSTNDGLPCRIEYARMGIETGGNLGYQNGFYSGGRIQSIQTVFLNCKESFHVMRANDKGSYFKMNKFELTSEYGTRFQNQPFQRHMYYNRTYGYAISGCIYINTDAMVSNWNQRGMGVYALNSPVRIADFVWPNTPAVHTSFTGFNRGIHASVTNANYHGLVVTDAVFHQNKEAIYCNNVSFHYLNRNEIHVGELTGLPLLDNAQVVYTGIYQYRGSQFEIMENNIYGYITAHPWVDDIAKPYTVGICGSRTKTTDDEIYKNYLHNLNFGNLANGDNNEDIANNGLRYVCNENDGNHYDFAVTDNFMQAYAADVAEMQADLGTDPGETAEQAAGNKFFDVVPDPLNIMEGQNFWNMGLNWDMEYKAFDDPNDLEIPNDVLNLDLVVFGTSNTCASETHKLVLEDGSIDQVALGNWTERMDESRTNWQSTLFLWKSLIDGGSTEELQEEIDFAWTEDTWEMRDLLLSHSPYVSAEVLTDVADNTTLFPHAVALEIFMANPDVLSDAKFMLHLEEKTDPMPQYMIDLLWAAAYQVTFRTVLEDELRLHRSIYMEAAGKVMRTHLSDTTYTTTQWIADLSTLRTTNAEFQLIEYYLDEGDATMAGNRWHDMPTNCTMSLYELRDWELFENYLDLRTDMIAENKDWNMLSGPQVEALEYIAYENFYGYAGNLAQQVLNEYYGGDFDIEPAVSLGDPNLRSEKVNTSTEISLLKLYPNPASDFCIVQLSLSIIDENYSLRVTDVNGKLILQQKIVDTKQQIAIDMQTMSAGTYFITALNGEEVLQTKELNVIK